MSRTFDAIDDALAAFIGAQHVFFVATAPSARDGHLNLSPKGLDAFRILDAHTVAYLDLTGSGIETLAHLQDDGRIVLMFCAFEGAANIVRLHGRGEIVTPDAPDFAALRGRFPALAGVRSIVRVRVDRISDSCGFGVPLYRYEGMRADLVTWAERKGDDGLEAYRRERNAASVDGLPGWPPRRSR